ncbi:MAG: ABC transporter permease [SAR202 cluster bacterium]|jgi:peptide/nickel transport system permease protein|nr:ABC transporter permease [SAR202 cluster bacterium]MDP6511577.1 ABC transporter permease [SAR202 cluster bacterium]MDP6713332.1 ABC transporter permease [SAR202 cluster bacterium]
MQQYIARRLLYGLLTAVLVSLLVFALMRIAPGDVAQMIAIEQSGGDASAITDEQLATIREALGLNDALHIQYIKWMGDFVTGDWGESLFSRRSVFTEFVSKFPVTFELVILSQIVAVVLGIPAGIIMALKQDTRIDYIVRILSLAALSVPSFWSATLLLLGGAYFLGWNPQLGYAPFLDDPLANLQQFLWPSLMLGYISAATKARMMRSTMLEVLRQDYIRTAHAKGLAAFVVTSRHALKNAFIPVVTVIGITTALALGGSVVMERIFTLPGIGNYILDGMLRRDFPVVQSVVLLFAAGVIIVNLLVDLSYGWLDPRVRFQ